MQSRTNSLIESATNILIGYWCAVLTQLIVFPIMGIDVSLNKNLMIGLVFTLISLLRSYVIRRAFNRFG
ncbi:hypothetical protein UFOVP365_25 [uncultured Caudovirales phage]|uniref:Uncharacterized protein n=1 Tax=uncultured Caudovirales phage TaxID=2100421 RepID=A0A6J7X0W3_9CAUD|nr:hypothetical protein UFOVP365_25 [uncultured Caudovirales phage]